MSYTAWTQPWSTTVQSGGPPGSESSTAPEDLTWEEWGPHHTRCFVDIGGRRLFYSQKIVMDFNEFAVSRDLCRTGNLARLKSRELQAQMHDKDLAQAVTEVAADVSGDPGRGIVLKSSVIRGVFTKDVVTWLPYRVAEISCESGYRGRPGLHVMSVGCERRMTERCPIAGTRDVSSFALCSDCMHITKHLFSLIGDAR